MLPCSICSVCLLIFFVAHLTSCFTGPLTVREYKQRLVTSEGTHHSYTSVCPHIRFVTRILLCLQDRSLHVSTRNAS
jgi:hypothetical protein